MRADRNDLAAELTADEVLADAADGPEDLSDDPTIIGVGEILGAGFDDSLIVGIEFVTTTLTGVGVGSTVDCDSAGRLRQETNNATHKSFVFITSVPEIIYYVKGAAVRGVTRLNTDSLIIKKVVKLKTFIYTNHKDKLYM